MGSFAPKGTLVMFRDISIVMTEPTVLQCIDARDVAKHPTVHRTTPHNKVLFIPKVSIALKMRNSGLKSSVGIHITGKYGCLSPNQT